MATFTGAERVRCVFWFEETKSATQVQRKFRTQYRKEPPSRPTIYSWHKNFIQTGFSVRHAKSPGRPRVSDATVEQIRESFVRSPRKSTPRASRETGIPNVTVWRVLRKRLHLKSYKLSIVQHLTVADKVVRKEFCMKMFHRMQDDEKFLDSVILSDESTFHVSGNVNTHNCRIWGNENPRVALEHVRDSPNVNVFCTLSKERVYGPFFFMETTITGIAYLDMLQEFLIPQLDEDVQEGRIHFQQDVAPPHYLGEVREYFNTLFPGRWIGGGAPIAWPPRSPDLTPLDFFLWGFVNLYCRLAHKNNTTIATFADDIALLAANSDPVVTSQHLQHHLKLLQQWDRKWKIKIDQTKSVQVTFTTKRITFPPVTINNMRI
ncbi:hypothetical protein B7P43_G08552 [Cryptotermes secundus]|uniref:DUF4817 domain-containing protein n=1 Tax=Cryptotermes secundus TaxID=105785 RepID=A0A2J7QES7_9NEOP|nr:hypothetical protein B7P43_G08552 [Cryptotermes secundus]